MIDFTTGMPLQDAVDSISRRTPIGTRLSSAEWELMPAEIRLRSLWAARMENENVVAGMHARLEQRLRLERSKLEDGGEGVTMDRRRFIDQTREDLKRTGYNPDPEKKGGLQDFTSDRRLGLIWQMNLDQAQGYAQWKTSMDPDILAAVPAMEFVRLESRMERRIWPVKWAALGGKFYPGASEYPEGRMIALKTSDIWKRLNWFGVPWKPFDWGSGMGTRNVRRKECVALGIIKPGDAAQVPEKLPFNAGAEASLRGITPDRRRAIEDSFQGDVEIEGNVIRLLSPEAIPADFVLPRMPKALAPAESEAKEIIDRWTDDQKREALAAIEKTVAWSRLNVAAKQDGSAGLDADETLVRALSQFLADDKGKAAIAEHRMGPLRDLLWGLADFASVASVLAGLIGGGA